MGQFDTRHESIIIAKHLFSIRFWSIRFPVRFEKKLPFLELRKLTTYVVTNWY